MRRPDVYGVVAVAALLGVHRNTVLSAITGGRLRGRKARWGKERNRFEVRRDDLVRFLLARGDEPAAVRRLFASAEAVALVRTPAAVQAAVARLMPTIQCAGLFDLGRLVAEGKVWAAVLNLAELGTAATARELQAFHAQPGRVVELIALVPDDGVKSLPSPVPFDVPIGEATSPAAVASTVLRLRARATGAAGR